MTQPNNEPPTRPSAGWINICFDSRKLCLHYLKIREEGHLDKYYAITERNPELFNHRFAGIPQPLSYKQIPHGTIFSLYKWEFYTTLEDEKFLFLLSFYDNNGKMPFKLKSDSNPPPTNEPTETTTQLNITNNLL